MKVNINSAIGRAVADYTGDEVIYLEVVPDPNVAGTFAVRAMLVDNILENVAAEAAEFLLVNVPLHKVTADHLEEVEFTAWPPTSNAACWPRW